MLALFESLAHVEPVDLFELKAQSMQHPEFFVGGAGIESFAGLVQAGTPALGVEDFVGDGGHGFVVIKGRNGVATVTNRAAII